MTPYKVARDYYGHYWYSLLKSHQEKRLEKITRAMIEYHNIYQKPFGGWLFWRKILRAIPKRPRCHICHAPPTRWKETAHGKRRGETNNRWNCLREPSLEFTQEMRLHAIARKRRIEVLQAAQAMRDYYWRAKQERREEGKWIKESRKRLRAVKSYLNPKEPRASLN